MCHRETEKTSENNTYTHTVKYGTSSRLSMLCTDPIKMADPRLTESMKHSDSVHGYSPSVGSSGQMFPKQFPTPTNGMLGSSREEETARKNLFRMPNSRNTSPYALTSCFEQDEGAAASRLCINSVASRACIVTTWDFSKSWLVHTNDVCLLP